LCHKPTLDAGETHRESVSHLQSVEFKIEWICRYGVHACNPSSVGRMGQEDWEFKASLGYIVSKQNKMEWVWAS
jgi:hypothetical protein